MLGGGVDNIFIHSPSTIALSLPSLLMIGLFAFEACLEGQKVNVEDLIEDGRSAEESTVQRPGHAVTEHVLTCTHTNAHSNTGHECHYLGIMRTRRDCPSVTC